MIYIYKTYIDFINENDEYHRVGGPSFIGKFRQSWSQNGKLHRLDGPAIIDIYFQSWYIEGIKYTETEFHNKLKEMGL